MNAMQTLIPSGVLTLLHNSAWGHHPLQWTVADTELARELRQRLLVSDFPADHLLTQADASMQVVSAGTGVALPATAELATEPLRHSGSPKQTPAEKSAVRDRLQKVMHDGFSLILNTLENRDANIAQICRQLASQFHCETGCNAYFTPPHGQALSRHYDDEDVIIFQVAGYKHWTLWHPGTPGLSPLTGVPYCEQNALEGPLQSRVTLTEGMCLYLPAGFPHAARAGDAASLHLTFSLAALRIADLALPALQSLLMHPLHGAQLRQRLPLQWLQARQTNPTAPVLALSASTANDNTVQALSASGSDSDSRGNDAARQVAMLLQQLSGHIREYPEELNGVMQSLSVSSTHFSLPASHD